MANNNLLYLFIFFPWGGASTQFYTKDCEDNMINMYYSEYLLELYSNYQRLHSYQFGQTGVENS